MDNRDDARAPYLALKVRGEDPLGRYHRQAGRSIRRQRTGMADSTETRKQQRTAARAERQRAEAARERTRRRLIQLGGALVLAAVVVVAIVLATSGGSDKPKLKAGEKVPGQSDTAALFAGIPQKGIELGNPKAPVTFVEFADLQCPFCRLYTTTLMPTLVANYVRTGKVKMEFRNLAFIGTDSTRAAQAAAGAGEQNKLWQFIDLFYANQGEENTSYVTDDFLRKIGGGVAGLDVTKMMNDRGTSTVQKQLTDAEQQAQLNGVNSTPTFLVGRTGGTLKEFKVTAFELGQFSSHIDPLLAKQ
jgi:protein-disulfide isomerase